MLQHVFAGQQFLLNILQHINLTVYCLRAVWASDTGGRGGGGFRGGRGGDRGGRGGGRGRGDFKPKMRIDAGASTGSKVTFD